MSSAVTAVLAGLGPSGYAHAVRALVEMIEMIGKG
jgi:3-dehydroquinate dehydratase